MSISLFIFCLLLRIGSFSTDEERLFEDKLKIATEEHKYRRMVIPVETNDELIEVKFGVGLIQVINFDEQNQVLITNVWLRHSWVVHKALQWEPEDYGNITIIRVPAEYVWLPDIVLLNNANGGYEVTEKVRVLMWNTGWTEWIPPAIFQTSCKIDVTYFPYDQQKCDMQFGSWTFNGDQLKLGFYANKPMVSLDDYVKSAIWDLYEAPAYVYVDETVSPSRTVIVFQIYMKRKTLFYTVNLVLPCVLLSFLSIVVFYLPSDSQEKVTLSISLLVALVVFLLLIFKLLPPTSDCIPLLAKYLLFTFLMNVSTLVTTVAVINWNFRSPTTHAKRPWLWQVFIVFLPKFLCIKRPKTEANTSRPSSIFLTLKNKVNFMEFNSLHHPNCKQSRRCSLEDDAEPKEDYSFLMTLHPDAQKIIDEIEMIAENIRTEDAIDQVEEDWTYISLVIDRLLLYLFLAITVCGSVYLIFNAPGVFDFIDQDKILAELQEESSQNFSEFDLLDHFIIRKP